MILAFSPAPIPQADARAAAMRIIQHRMIESATSIEFELPMSRFPHRAGLVPRLPAAELTIVRRRLLEAHRGMCALCGTTIEDERDVTLDHVHPRSRRGGNFRNLVPAHNLCNSRKGSRLPTGCENIALAAVNAALYGQ